MRQKYHLQVDLTAEAREDLIWWSQEARSYNAAPIRVPPPDIVIETDASRLGWGTSCQELKTGDHWSLEEQELHINALELKAVLLAIQTFMKGIEHQHILVRTDNVTAKAYINHVGGTHSPILNLIASAIWKWCLDRHLYLTAEYLPGVENLVADKESRQIEDWCDWMLHP